MFISNRDMMLNRFIVPTQHVDNYMREQRKRKKESYKKKMKREEEFEMMLNKEIDEIEMIDGMMGDGRLDLWVVMFILILMKKDLEK